MQKYTTKTLWSHSHQQCESTACQHLPVFTQSPAGSKGRFPPSWFLSQRGPLINSLSVLTSPPRAYSFLPLSANGPTPSASLNTLSTQSIQPFQRKDLVWISATEQVATHIYIFSFYLYLKILTFHLCLHIVLIVSINNIEGMLYIKKKKLCKMESHQ